MSKGSKIISVRIPNDLLGRIQKEMALQVMKGAATTIALGEWIRKAMEQRLDHLARSRKPKKGSDLHCYECNKDVPAHKIVVQWQDLLGRKCYRCTDCDRPQARSV